MTNVAKLEPQQAPRKKLLEILADRYSVAPDIFEKTMATVAMPSPHTREELISCLIVANEHDLNPLTKEIHFMRSKTGQIQPIVGVDGWVKKLNTHPQFDGLKFDYEWSGANPGKKLFSVTCTIYRKDRKYPIEVTEFMSECIRLPGPGKGPNAWVLNPTRMLRHRALIQGTRYAIGFGGVMDMDEFERWQEMKDITPITPKPAAALEVPDDIPDEITVGAPVSEAEDNQAALLTNPQEHLEELEASSRMAKSEDEFNEIWSAHEELVEAGRLPRAYQEEAEAIKEQHAKKWAKT